jgi:mannose-6-phosphate isomerase-like protein (cupin superfamily)
MTYVFDTDDRRRYAFPTHINDLVIDRADATTSEVFVVIIEPGKSTHLHKHDDVEQILYIVEGNGVLVIGQDRKEFPVQPMQVVKIPPSTLHTIRVKGTKALRYICVDCFCGKRKKSEPTWEAHVKGICREQGYLFKDVARTRKPGTHRKR